MTDSVLNTIAPATSGVTRVGSSMAERRRSWVRFPPDPLTSPPQVSYAREAGTSSL